ncbi:hypothetical protein MPC4_330021 [Methylocella tundrae]|uniref:Uncharacterized protein n=1 Tax=Methylocella tundrae TaxID=227605 RepID=A0A8B6M9P6_METTU|nr:hypothetical protein [Methylocella tundrae]VTZ26964.1 hypothetical protein MPC1_430004 [Methylocella tundrae]VTZ51221.1 hypothetical protein MPC4_330021 [Methylocella tundrae]
MAELIDDLVRLEAAKGFSGRSALAARLRALPSLQDPPCDREFTKLSTVDRLYCLTRTELDFEERLHRHLCADPPPASPTGFACRSLKPASPVPVIAAWRRAIVTAGGIDASLRPLVRRMARRLDAEDDAPLRSRKRPVGERAAEFNSLLTAYGALHARRGLLDK